MNSVIFIIFHFMRFLEHVSSHGCLSHAGGIILYYHFIISIIYIISIIFLYIISIISFYNFFIMWIILVAVYYYFPPTKFYPINKLTQT